MCALLPPLPLLPPPLRLVGRSAPFPFCLRTSPQSDISSICVLGPTGNLQHGRPDEENALQGGVFLTYASRSLGCPSPLFCSTQLSLYLLPFQPTTELPLRTMSAPAVADAAAAEYTPASSPAKAPAASPKPASSSWASSGKPTSGPMPRKPVNAIANALSKPAEITPASAEPAVNAGPDSQQPGPDGVATQLTDEKPSEVTKPSDPTPPAAGKTLVLCFDGELDISPSGCS